MTRVLRHGLSTVALVLAFATATLGAQESVNDRIDRFVNAEMQRQRVPGIAVAVVKGGVVVKVQGYEVPAGSETVFQSGSLGKQFTAAAVMLQVEDGMLALSDSLTKFFPEAPQTWRAITVRHLLTHTSGIPDYGPGQIDYRKDYTEEDLARFAFDLTLEFPAGARWNYSNTGYVLLGIIVHKVSGSFYGSVLAERVFTPLGMTTARIISEPELMANRAAGYRIGRGEIRNQEWVSPTLNTTADGSLYLTVRDMVAWDAGIRARAVLQPESWQQMLTPAQLNSGKTYPYGFGWFLDERGGQPLQQHGGSWQGFKTQFSRFVGEDLSVIVLANLTQADPVKFADGIAEVMNADLALPVLRPIEDHDPLITTRCARLLDDARAGTLVPVDFAYMRGDLFPEGANRFQQRLRNLGAIQSMVLVSKTEVGDDRIFTYEVVFDSRTMYYIVAFAPDGKVSQFQLVQK